MHITNTHEPLKQRIATALGWQVSEVESTSLLSLRELVRPIDPKLAAEITNTLR